jgi:hypothetical protein
MREFVRPLEFGRFGEIHADCGAIPVMKFSPETRRSRCRSFPPIGERHRESGLLPIGAPLAPRMNREAASIGLSIQDSARLTGLASARSVPRQA